MPRASLVAFGTAIVAVATLFGGCAPVKPSDYQKQLQGVKVCCDTLSKLQHSEITLEKPLLRLDIGEKFKQALILDDSKTFAVLVKLPALSETYSIKIQSLPIGEAVMPPKVRLLNEDYSLSREFASDHFRMQRGQYLKTLFFNADDLDERYLLLYRDASAAGASHERTEVQVNASSVAMPGGGMISFNTASGDLKKIIGASDGGIVQMLLQSYSPDVVGQEQKNSP